MIEMSVDTVLTLQGQGKRALCGDVSNNGILGAAGIRQTPNLVVTLPDAAVAFSIHQRGARPQLEHQDPLVRAPYLSGRELLEPVNPDAVCDDEVEALAVLSVLLRVHVQQNGKRPAKKSARADG